MVSSFWSFFSLISEISGLRKGRDALFQAIRFQSCDGACSRRSSMAGRQMRRASEHHFMAADQADVFISGESSGGQGRL